MITEEDVAKHAWLPPEQRFYKMERVARDKLAEARREAGQNEWIAYDELDYMMEVLPAAEALGISELTDWNLPDPTDGNSDGYCRRFRLDATRVSHKLMIKYAGRGEQDPNTVALNAEAKKDVRYHLGEVRTAVERSNCPSWRKNELYEALSELEREIDKERTRLAAVLNVLGKAALGEVNVPDAVGRIVMIVQEAKDREEQKAKLLTEAMPQLPAANAKVGEKLPPQPKAAAKAVEKRKGNGFDKTIDDEIPF